MPKPNQSFPITFPECPLCHCKDTIAQLGCADEPSIPKDIFVALEKTATPIQQPTSMLANFVKAIVCSYDVCARCGIRYCTRAEKQKLPVNVQVQGFPNSPGGKPGGGQRPGGLPFGVG